MRRIVEMIKRCVDGGRSGQTVRKGTPLKFPYTFTAKVVQFPWMLYFRHNWIWKYYGFGIILSIPVFWKLNSMANSPENVARWKIIRQKELDEYRERMENL